MTPRETQRNLSVLPGGLDTGEVPTKGPQTLGQALAIIGRMEGRVRGLDLQIDNLKRELRQVHGEEPEADAVWEVVRYYQRRSVEEGWFQKTPTIKPGTDSWGHIRARMQRDGKTVHDCYLAIEGALAQDPRSTKREWVRVKSIFLNVENFERCWENAKDPMLERVRSNMLRLPDGIHRRDIDQLLEICDCNHRFSDHHKQLYAAVGKYADDDICGLFACASCSCIHFDRTHQLAEQWLRERGQHRMADGLKAGRTA